MKATLIRETFSPYQTLGKLTVQDAKGKEIFSCDTLELPWKNNKNRISCIPTGSYKAVFRDFGNYANRSFHIQTLEGEEVPGRTSILIHSGNFYTHTKGCILVGSGFADIVFKSFKKDGIMDLLNSRNTVSQLLELGDEFFIDIKNNKGEEAEIQEDLEEEEEELKPLIEGDKAIVCVKTKLNVRDEPSTTGNVVTALSNNEEVNILGFEGEWVNINYQIEGWVSSKYIEETDEFLVVNTKGGNLNIRSLPSTKGEKLISEGLKNKTELIFVEKEGNWTKVRTKPIKGYVYQDYLKK